MRRIAERIYTGSGALVLGMARGSAAWATAGSGAGDVLIRLASLLVAGGIAWSVLTTVPFLLWGAALCWCVVAWKRGAGKAAESPSPSPAKEDAKVLAALTELADPHVHLAVVAARLETSTAHVREALSRAGVPVTDGVRMKGRGVSTGVRAQDIPSPGPSREDPSSVVGAGQGSTTTVTSTVRRFESGLTVITTPDTDNPHRTHVQVVRPEGVES